MPIGQQVTDPTTPPTTPSPPTAGSSDPTQTSTSTESNGTNGKLETSFYLMIITIIISYLHRHTY